MGKLNDALKSAFKTTAAADELRPLPAGEYEADVIKGELTESRTGKPVYRLTFEVAVGPHDGRRFWHDAYLTEAAMPYAVRDLSKLFGHRPAPDELERPFPPGVRCRVKLTVRKSDAGTEFNQVGSFDMLTLNADADPYAPTDSPEGSIA